MNNLKTRAPDRASDHHVQRGTNARGAGHERRGRGGLQRILLGRNLDRVLAYVRMKMDLAVATNAELSAIRTQVLQMGSFLTVALVLGTGGSIPSSIGTATCCSLR